MQLEDITLTTGWFFTEHSSKCIRGALDSNGLPWSFSRSVNLYIASTCGRKWCCIITTDPPSGHQKKFRLNIYFFTTVTFYNATDFLTNGELFDPWNNLYMWYEYLGDLEGLGNTASIRESIDSLFWNGADTPIKLK